MLLFQTQTVSYRVNAYKRFIAILRFLCNDLQRYGGLQSNDLNVIMYDGDGASDENFEISNIGHSAYIDTGELTKYLEHHKNEFTVPSLNIQSINAKFNSLYAILVELAEKKLYFLVPSA